MDDIERSLSIYHVSNVFLHSMVPFESRISIRPIIHCMLVILTKELPTVAKSSVVA